MAWYDVDFSKEENLAQGEIIFNCSVLEPTATADEYEEESTELTAEIIQDNFIILSQSCDLEQANIETVVLAPIYSVGRFVAGTPHLRQKAHQCAANKHVEIPDREEDPESEAIFLQLAQECGSIRKEIDKIRRGDKPAYHLLDQEPEAGLAFSLVDFHRIYSAPKTYLLELARNQIPRIRLCPPYREHLSQAFARYFMRVGLPADIREFADSMWRPNDGPRRR